MVQTIPTSTRNYINMAHKTYSLFIGRWQPFHKGHKALVQTALDRGKNVCIGIRDMQISKDNPHTTKEIKKKIKKIFWDHDIKFVIIPDIDEVLYGRSVGYKIEKVTLSGDLHKVSGTRIRAGEIPND